MIGKLFGNEQELYSKDHHCGRRLRAVQICRALILHFNLTLKPFIGKSRSNHFDQFVPETKVHVGDVR